MLPEIPPSLAHELRSPLAAVIGTIDLVLDPAAGLEASEVEELLAGAKQEAIHLLALVEHARGRVGADGTRPVVLAEVARRVLERFPSVESRTHLQLDRRVVAVADPHKVDQVITNLVQNVDRYAPAGEVALRLRREGPVVVLECEDDGPGILPADAERIFTERGTPGGRGLHVGLALSRRLARSMGGDLALVPGRGTGATFRLSLPPAETLEPGAAFRARALAPRARVAVEMAEALAHRTPERVEAGLFRLVSDLLGAMSTAVLVGRHGRYLPANPVHAGVSVAASDPDVCWGEARARLVEGDAPEWWRACTGAERGLLVRLDSGAEVRALLAIGLGPGTEVDPGSPVIEAVAVVAGLAVDRTVLAAELVLERKIRASVMEALPIAISIFAGDPPRVIDWNEAERRLIGLDHDADRPPELADTQRRFDVRFLDGSPLTVDNALVTEAIRLGRRTGPILLRLRRSDGSEVVARTHCAPFFNEDGTVAGAVVASEEIGEPGSLGDTDAA